jgi:hypothetical protein
MCVTYRCYAELLLNEFKLGVTFHNLSPSFVSFNS